MPQENKLYVAADTDAKEQAVPVHLHTMTSRSFLCDHTNQGHPNRNERQQVLTAKKPNTDQRSETVPVALLRFSSVSMSVCRSHRCEGIFMVVVVEIALLGGVALLEEVCYYVDGL